MVAAPIEHDPEREALCAWLLANLNRNGATALALSLRRGIPIKKVEKALQVLETRGQATKLCGLGVAARWRRSKMKKRCNPKRRHARKHTIPVSHITREDRAQWTELYGPGDHWRPQTRCDCITIERPCPYVSCAHNLYLDVRPTTGSITLNFPDLKPWEMNPEASCALDVAEYGGITLDAAGTYVNLTRERVRQVELGALKKLRDAGWDLRAE